MVSSSAEDFDADEDVFKSQYIMSLFDQVSKDIVAAMKAKDKVRLEALRNIKKFS